MTERFIVLLLSAIIGLMSTLVYLDRLKIDALRDELNSEKLQYATLKFSNDNRVDTLHDLLNHCELKNRK